ncbi:MAG TPA: cyclic nucleotide-binding domain-containing protein [Bacteroidales bacterium]|nr:cyclic nucleotide-binding domain-containing protein [Bacteroidales bacterium]
MNMQGNHEIQEKLSILKKVSVFDDVHDDDLEKIAAALEQKEVVAGQTIFKKDESGDTLYIVAGGKVRVHDEGHVLGRLENGEVFGEFSLFDNEKRSASVTAEEKTRLFLLGQDAFYKLMATNSSVIHGVMKVLIKRLRYMNELENKLSKSYLKISKQKEEIEKRNENIRQQKKELEEKNKMLEQSNLEKNHLIQVIAHDLKNPLASSICIADILAGEATQWQKEQAESVEVLNNSLKNMNNIINQILDVYELKTKNLSLKLTSVNLALEAKKTIENFDYAISKKELNVDFRQKNSFALVDTNLINLVFENLIYNFIKYSDDFGNLLIDFDQDEHKVKIIIEDDAKQQKETHYRKLFGFYQKPAPEQLGKFPTTEDSVIVKYVEAMDGKIKLTKSDTKGSRVVLIFNKPVNQKNQ